MELQNLGILNLQALSSIFFKIFAVILSFFYLFYAIVVSKQTQVMNKTLEIKDNHIFFIVSSAQISIGIILIILAIVLV